MLTSPLDDTLLAIAQVMMVGLTAATWICELSTPSPTKGVLMIASVIKKSYIGYHLKDIPEGAVDHIETGKVCSKSFMTVDITHNLSRPCPLIAFSNSGAMSTKLFTTRC
jgi:hypothetical protein